MDCVSSPAGVPAIIEKVSCPSENEVTSMIVSGCGLDSGLSTPAISRAIISLKEKICQ